MAGLFGLFGKKNNTEAANNGNTNGQAYFLDADQSKTLGNIEYMRTPKSVRRTFPKTATNGGEFEQTKVISAMGEMSTAKDFVTKPEMNSVNPQPTTESSAQQNPAESDRRRPADSSMDMFRNMARDIKKR